MKKVLFILITLLYNSISLASISVVKGEDELIIPGLCLYDSTDGTTPFTTLTSEEAGLEIRLRTSDGAVKRVADATTEIEDITTTGSLDTWEDPSGINVVRFEKQEDDCYQVMFEADSVNTGNFAILTIKDTSTPGFLPRDWLINFRASEAQFEQDVKDALTSFTAATQQDITNLNAVIQSLQGTIDSIQQDTQVLGSPNDLGGSGATIAQNLIDIYEDDPEVFNTLISSVTSPTEIVLTDGAPDDNAYNNCHAFFRDSTTANQVANARIRDYVGSTNTIILSFNPNIFVVTAGDIVKIDCGVQ